MRLGNCTSDDKMLVVETIKRDGLLTLSLRITSVDCFSPAFSGGVWI